MGVRSQVAEVLTRPVPGYVGWLVLALLLWGGLYVLANRMVFYPMRYPEGFWGLQEDLGVEDVRLTASDGIRIHAWWRPVADAPVATLFLHGNAGNITHRGRHFRALAAAGSAVLILDYRGYGRSDGSPSEAGLYRDADAAYHWLLERFPARRIVIHGESLGGAVAVDLASRRECAGVVLEAPFNSAGAVAGKVLPGLGRLLIFSFNSKSKIRGVRAPLLFIHGRNDEVIPYSLGRDLYEAAPEPKAFWTLEAAGHNDIPESAGEAYVDRLAAFYRRLPGREGSR